MVVDFVGIYKIYNEVLKSDSKGKQIHKLPNGKKSVTNALESPSVRKMTKDVMFSANQYIALIILLRIIKYIIIYVLLSFPTNPFQLP